MTSSHSWSDPDAAGPFADVLAGNQVFSDAFSLAHLEPRARRGLAIVTCMDSRIAPLEVLGLDPGDAKILRNAGGRVTDDVLRTLILAVHLLGVRRVLVMPHTHCRMAESTEDELHDLIAKSSGVDTSSVVFGAIGDQMQTLVDDLGRVQQSPFMPADIQVAGAVYDVASGRLGPFVSPPPAPESAPASGPPST
jgi:carbonic anhydrase